MFKLTIVTPEKRLALNLDAEHVTVPAHRGQLHILPGHSPIMTTLDTGVLRWKLVDQEEPFRAAISWGYCEINPEGVYILADIAHFPNEIELNEQEGVIKKTLEKLGKEGLNDTDWKQTQRELQMARASIDVMPLTKKHH